MAGQDGDRAAALGLTLNIPPALQNHITGGDSTIIHDSPAGISPAPQPDHDDARIPPPPSPRRHRSGLMARLRSQSGGVNQNKSWADLHMLGLGMSMTAAPPRIDTSPQSLDDAKQPPSVGSDDDGGAWDNSARFYHHRHTSRPGSPTRSMTLTSQQRSPSPGSAHHSNVHLRSNPSSTAVSPAGATLSAALSPNTRFLQQHLPPTFPMGGSLQPTPDGDNDDPLPATQPHSMVILTPTTQEWRELKELSRIEGKPVTSDGESGSSESDGVLSPKARKERSTGGETQHEPTSSGPSEPPTPIQTAFSSVVIAPSPGPTSKFDHEPDNDVALSPTDATIHSHSFRRFSSIGRRDSLMSQSSVESSKPRPKTKREIERERLFRMVDEEIADSSPTEASSGVSWGIQSHGGRGLSVGYGRGRGDVDDEPQSTTNPLPDRSEQTDSQPLTGPSKRDAPPVASSSLSIETFAEPAQASDDEEEVQLTSPVKHATEISQTSNEAERFAAIRNYSRNLSGRHSLRPRSAAPSRRGSMEDDAPRSPRRRNTNRTSLVSGRLLQPLSFTPAPTAPSPPSQGANLLAPSGVSHKDISSLQSFSPFRPPGFAAKGPLPRFDSVRSSVSFAPSTGVPSGQATPTSDSGGAGGHGIDDYVILKEAGKGAYGMVMRAKVKGKDGKPIGDEVIIKYIIKSRILADCWKKHKVLGPIPIEIHVMDQLRHLIYQPPNKPHPWDPARPRPGTAVVGGDVSNGTPSPALEGVRSSSNRSEDSRASTPSLLDSGRNTVNPTQRYLASEIRHAPERGHPNICKLLDFFEDREFYYMVMPRYGTGLDLFDRVESQPAGLDPFECRSILGQLTDAIAFLHANGIVHRDIKDENVILDGDGHCQIIDFGSAAHWRPGKKWDTFSGTLHYGSPEILRGSTYGGKEQDVWALGVVAYVVLVGETPFETLPDDVLAGLSPGTRALECLEARCSGEHASEGRAPDGGGSLGDAADFVSRCLEMELGDRPSAEQLLRHRYLIGEGGWVGHRGWQK